MLTIIQCYYNSIFNTHSSRVFEDILLKRYFVKLILLNQIKNLS